MASPWRLWSLLLLGTLSGVCAEDARIASMANPPAWQLDSLMHLQLTAPETEALQLTYSVYPLTEHAGLNLTDRSAIWVRGNLVAAEIASNADTLKSPDTIAFLSCDGENATAEVNQLMDERPRAILLYSMAGNCCSLDGDDLVYTSIFTMGDSSEAQDTMNNTIRAGGILRATITGNANATSTPQTTQEQSGSNSAVAMSILYSITGLITLLFLVIIGTGAIRAHRYPERYGPRSGHGGRPSQSRARGLARAVLETLPIVKFGDPTPAKADPALELESQRSATPPDSAMGTRLSAIPEEPRTPRPRQSDDAPMSGAVSLPETLAEETPSPDAATANRGETQGHHDSPDDHLGCSICTEDFTVGEDVRVLPCDHKFHPPCIDPWLTNISGTCPLCRLDLHPQSRPSSPVSHDDNWTAPDINPTQQQQQTQTQQRRRSSRFLDLHRLRHASIEERIEILRRHRSQQQQQQQQQHRESSSSSGGTDGTATGTGEIGDGEVAAAETEEQRSRGARLAERLRERFHIRTRAASLPRGGSV